MAENIPVYEVDDLFKVHKLNATGLTLAKNFGEVFTNVLRIVEGAAGTAPEVGRDLAMVRTYLQIASFYSKRAMAKNPYNQIKE